MKIHYSQLKNNHYSSNTNSANYLSAEGVYEEIGHSYNELVKQNPGYENTCAIRMSLALLKSGISFKGRLKINAGKYQGRYIETGAKLLADQLSLAGVFGKPEIFKPADAFSKVSRKGVVFFSKIAGYGGGHVDLIETSSFGQVCHSNCYPLCKEVWFWELP